MPPNDSENKRSGCGLFSVLQEIVEFWDRGERILATLAGLFLAVIFCLMPFNELGKDDPWYFWVGSGLIALVVSVLLSWVYFPPVKNQKTNGEESEVTGENRQEKSSWRCE